MKKLIISAALTGAATNRSHCPAIPYTPEEIGEEARRSDEPDGWEFVKTFAALHELGVTHAFEESLETCLPGLHG